MTSKAQQIELDNALVAPKNHHVIGKCNMKINPRMKPKEPTYQVALDALDLTKCYPAFLITAEVPVIYIHHFWATEALSFIRELGHSGEIKYITDVIVDPLHQPWRTFASIINKCLCGKEDLAYQIDNIDSKKQDKMFYPRFTKIIIHHFLEKYKSISMRNRTFMHTARDDSLLGTMRFVSKHADTQVYGSIIPKATTIQALLDSVAYKTYYAIASGAEPPKSRKSQKKSDSAISSEESPSKKKSAKAKKVVVAKPKPAKKKAPVKADRGKGLNVLSKVALSEGFPMSNIARLLVQIKELVVNQGFPMYANTIPKVRKSLRVTVEKKKMMMKTILKMKMIMMMMVMMIMMAMVMMMMTKKIMTHMTMTKKLAVIELSLTESRFLFSNSLALITMKKKKKKKKKKRLTMKKQWMKKKMMRSLRTWFEQVKEDSHVTLTPVLDTQKTDEPVQSSSVSSNFTSKLLNLENPSLADNKIASLMDTTVRHEEPRKVTTAVPALLDFASIFRFNDRVTNLERDLSELKQVDQYAQAISLIPAIMDRYMDNKLGEAIFKAIQSHNAKCKKEAQDEKQEYIDNVDSTVRTIIREEVKTKLPKILPKAVSAFATPVIEINVTESLETAILASQVARAKEPHTSFDVLMDTSFDFFTFVMNRLNIKDLTQEILVGPVFELLKGTCESLTELEYHLEECSKAKNERLHWHNHKGKPYPFNLSKLLPLIRDHQGRQVIPRDFFINNDLEYLKGEDLSRHYSTSSPMKMIYDKHAYWGTSHWGPKHQHFYRLMIMKKYDYGHLEEIEVHRENQKLYKFREGDFLRLRLQDIEDMLLLLAQPMLANLTIDVRITATNKVPLREPIPLEVVAQESVVTKAYTRRPKVPKTNGSNSKPKIIKSMIPNKKEPGTSLGSNTSVAPSSSSFVNLRTRASIYDSCNIQFKTCSKPYSQQPCIPPPRNDRDCLFQPIFDEYFNPPTIVVSSVPVTTAPRTVDLADSPVSTLIDHDAPSTSAVDPTLFTQKAGNDLLL
nr:hypothetical protein [Tanacetum cinerariifolium]